MIVSTMKPPPPPDPSQLRQRVLKKITVSPTVLLPTLLGATALIGSWAFGGGMGLVAFAGVAGMLTGLGTLATRWMFGFDKAFDAVVSEDERRRRRAWKRQLDRLERGLRQDRDRRTEKMLERLREMHEQFEEDLAHRSDHMTSAQLVEIAGKSDQLFLACVASLERSLQLWHTARRMNTDAGRETAMEARERVLVEVQESTDQLARIYDGVTTLALGGDEERTMTAIREELAESMSVAERVEERMRSIGESLSRNPEWERGGGRWE